jgi:hypothetical protein
LICLIVGFQLHYLSVELQAIPTPGEYQLLAAASGFSIFILSVSKKRVTSRVKANGGQDAKLGRCDTNS